MTDHFRQYLDPSDFARRYLLHSDSIGHLTGKDFYTNRNFYPYNHIIYVLSGKVHFIQFGRHHVITPGSGILFRMDIHHLYYSDHQDIAQVLWIHIGGETCERYISLIENAAEMPCIFKSDTIMRYFYNAFNILKENEKDYELKLSIEIFGMLLDILTNVSTYEKPTFQTQDELFMRRATQYIQKNIKTKITLREFASECYVDKFYLCHNFKRISGTTFKQYVLSEKIKFAESLLKTTGQTISYIAQELGFTDHSHFSRTFYKVKGKYPSDYISGENKSYIPD